MSDLVKKSKARKTKIAQDLAMASKEVVRKKKTEKAKPVEIAEKPIRVEMLSKNVVIAKKQKILAARGLLKLTDKNPGKAFETAKKAAKNNMPEGDKNAMVIINDTLKDDLESLRSIPDINQRKSVKLELLEKYLPLAKAYLDGESHYNNPVLVYCIIWLLDTEQMEEAINYAALAIMQNQKLPEHFKRDLAEFVVEEIAEWACLQSKKKESASPYIETVIEAVESGAWPVMNAIVVGKLYLYAGKIRDNFEEYKEALDYYQKAMAANDDAGCKTRINVLTKKLGIDG